MPPQSTKPSRSDAEAARKRLAFDIPYGNDEVKHSSGKSTFVEKAARKAAKSAPPCYHDVCLFSLNIRKRFKPAKPGVCAIGIFQQFGDSYSFYTVEDGTPEHVSDCENLLPGLAPILSLCAQHGATVFLRGDVTKQGYAVSELHLTDVRWDSNCAPIEIRDPSLQRIIARVVFDAFPDKMTKDYWLDSILYNKAEATLLFHALEHILPTSTKNWAEQTLLRAGISSEYQYESAHALKAISYMLTINWRPHPPRVPDAQTIKARLDQGFFGLEDVKTRIMEIAAQVRRAGHYPQWGILLNGPAGVGKTSIAKAIADVLNLPLVSLDMSTLSDPEGLVGSSRIYANAKPGVIVEKLAAAKDTNCMFLINELDKAATAARRGSPADTLLTLVDKLGFLDVFMESPIDTRNAFFIATCNDIDQISKPLQDRFLRIDIKGYSLAEKKEIFSRYVFPKALEASNVSPQELTFTEEFLDDLCRNRATAPGIRDLEQIAERIIGDYLLSVETGHIESRQYTPADLSRLLGDKPVSERHVVFGPGLAKTVYLNDGSPAVGLIEASSRPGAGGFQILGAPNGFYSDCCKAAYEAVRNISDAPVETLDITVHLPILPPMTVQNTIGCAVFIAIMSAVTGKAVSEEKVFLGGCDIYGNLSWGSQQIDPVIELAERSGLTQMYGPINLGEHTSGSSQVQIIGTFNAGLLFELI